MLHAICQTLLQEYNNQLDNYLKGDIHIEKMICTLGGDIMTALVTVVCPARALPHGGDCCSSEGDK